MELYDFLTPVETKLATIAALTKTPLGGAMELLPLCNMDCKMCYVRLSRKQMEQQGKMLSADEWLKIAEEAKKQGVLFLLLTGGEVLIYPEFRRLYQELHLMGFILTINTNATLLDEEWADFFKEYPCRKINITLYGKDDATYERLCGNPKGFTQVMHAAKLLKEREIPFRFTCSVTPDNQHQLDELQKIAEEFGVSLEITSYMFPPARKEEYAGEMFRMTPKEAAVSILESYRVKNGGRDMEAAVENTLRMVKMPEKRENIHGLSCRAGTSGFWLNWKGEMLPCGMFQTPKISLTEHSFKECWEYIVNETEKMVRCAECEQCEKKNICKSCAAACLTETGSVSGKPEYLCQMSEELYRLLQEYSGKNEVLNER